MSINKSHFFRKKLTKSSISYIVSINFLVPLLTYLLIHFLLKKHMDSPYYDTIIFLAILLCSLFLLVLNVIFILQPILRLDKLSTEYKHLYNSAHFNEGYERSNQDQSLEVKFKYMLKAQKEYIEREYKSEMLQNESKLLALQSQINPHFLYNTLDSIRGFALIHDIREISEMTEALSNLFRNMVSKEGKLITLHEEIENVNNYMLIQQFRFNNKFQFKVLINEYDLLLYKVPNLIIQPLVENAIMHGLEQSMDEGTVTISAYTTEKRLIINVTDNGIGFSEDKLNDINKKIIENKTVTTNDKHTGIGLTNIDQRIKLQFGNDYGLSIMSTPNVRTTIEIVLPKITVNNVNSSEGSS